MARAEYINAILSGKLGGAVYSRNKSGAYIRNYVKPTNANTKAQQSARANFAGAASGFGTLGETKRQGWNEFAITNFRPKSAKSGIAWSGFNAFLSLKQVVRQSKTRTRTATAVADATAIVLTQSGFEFNNSAPVALMPAQIVDSTSQALSITLTAATLAPDFAFTATFTLERELTAAPLFTPIAGQQDAGIVFYMSEGRATPDQYVQRPDEIMLAALEPISSIADWPAGGASDITFSWTNAGFEAGDYKALPQSGSWVRLSAYLTGANGQQQPLSSIDVQVS